MITPLLRELKVAAPAFRELLQSGEEEQRAAGYYHTLREICQQPLTWRGSVEAAGARAADVKAALESVRTVALTGSGSSLYAGQCAAPGLARDLGREVQAVAAGDILTDGVRCLPPRPCLVVSLARSGSSPESCAAVDRLLASEPGCRHLAITCNAKGGLATRYRGTPSFLSLVLDGRTNDHSLVMTSSFTNMVLAARTLGKLDGLDEWRATVDRLAAAASDILHEDTDSLAGAARRPFRSAAYLASWTRFGAAREAALKLQEMTAGRVYTFAETFLGLRHGPMSALGSATAVVCFLSSDKTARAYELDLIEELGRKRLGAFKVIAGERIPDAILRPGDVAVRYPEGLADADLPVLDVLTAQLLAFFRCRAEGLRPDEPSASKVITRVVEPFRIYTPSEAL